MAKAKDRPLLLRKRTDGKTYLQALGPGKPPTWPPRHEFSLEWLMTRTISGEVKMSEDRIEIQLANASAVYRITQRPQEVVNGEKSLGYWGKLIEGKVS